jgi:hypothetical protein
VTIDCPSDCPHLITAHRYEAEHRKPIPPEEFPYRDVEVSEEFVYERWPVVSNLASFILTFQIQNKDVNDGIARAALEALAETYRTLATGIYYERPPDAALPRALYAHIAEFFQEFHEQESSPAAFPSLKDSDVFHLLVFLLRVLRQQSSGRPRSRAFLDFLRARFPLPESNSKEGPRIVIP